MNYILTKDSEKLLSIVYKDYLEKRKSGMAKKEANYYGSSHVIHEHLLPKWLFSDVDDTCRELSRAEMINCKWADNIAVHIRLSDQAISYMENRFKNGLSEVTDFIAKFIP